MQFRSDFRGIGNPGTYNCRLKKRTGLGPHPTLKKPQFWPLFRGMSGVLKLLIPRNSKMEKNNKNAEVRYTAGTRNGRKDLSECPHLTVCETVLHDCGPRRSVALLGCERVQNLAR